MRRAALAVLIGGALACARPGSRLPAAGGSQDDGRGVLARASVQIVTGDGEGNDLHDARHESDELDRAAVARDDDDEDDEDDAADNAASVATARPGAYGGATYASYVVPSWSAPPVDRKPAYRATAGLTGALEGRVTWHGARPARLATACGPVDALRLGTGAPPGVPDVLVYIARVQVGRVLPYDSKPSAVGGTVVKRGCVLAPAVQIVTPLPAPLAIHSDRSAARIVVTPPTGPAEAHAVDAGGHVALEAKAGTTRIAGEDGSLAAAWVLALDTPYYALTDDAGRFRIDELAAGTYDVTIWQAPIPTIVDGTWRYAAPVVAQRTVRIGTGRPGRIDIALGR